MKMVRSELAESLAQSTGWDVTTDARRFTFVNDDPPQAIVWTVSDAELGHLRFVANSAAKSYGGRRSAGRDRCAVHARLRSHSTVRRYTWRNSRDRSRDDHRVVASEQAKERPWTNTT
ncbi:hypothetical protein GCM10009813_14910 [Brevibacterium marinum]